MRAIDGRVTVARGAVLDVAFGGGELPPIDCTLVITPGKGTRQSPRCSRIWTRRRFARLRFGPLRGCVVARGLTRRVAEPAEEDVYARAVCGGDAVLRR
jgi:hypothetical protein